MNLDNSPYNWNNRRTSFGLLYMLSTTYTAKGVSCFLICYTGSPEPISRLD